MRRKSTDLPLVLRLFGVPDASAGGTTFAISRLLLCEGVQEVCLRTSPSKTAAMTIQDLEATVRKIYLLGLLYVGLSLGYLMRSPQPFEIPDDPPVTVTVEDPLDG